MQRAKAESPAGVPMTIQEYAEMRVLTEFGEGQWESFNQIVMKESRWDHLAQNPTSTAYGIMQFLSSTWKSVDCVKTDIPEIQVDCGIRYIKKRYGNPQKALDFHRVNNYY